MSSRAKKFITDAMDARRTKRLRRVLNHMYPDLAPIRDETWHEALARAAALLDLAPQEFLAQSWQGFSAIEQRLSAAYPYPWQVPLLSYSRETQEILSDYTERRQYEAECKAADKRRAEYERERT